MTNSASTSNNKKDGHFIARYLLVLILTVCCIDNVYAESQIFEVNNTELTFLNRVIENKDYSQAHQMIDHWLQSENLVKSRLVQQANLIAELKLKEKQKYQSYAEHLTVGQYFGGEEFCILLPNQNASGGLEKAEQIRKAIEQFRYKGTQLTCSFGVVEYTDDLQSHDRFIDRADEALYHSKSNGRNQVTLWSEALVKCNSGANANVRLNQRSTKS